LGRSPATVLTLQQAGQSARLEGIHPIEKSATADTQLLGNLGGGQLPADGQTRGQQTLLAFHILTSVQPNGKACAKSGRFNWYRFGMSPFACIHRIVHS